jgi:NAD(P)-dependent dehydrogenase (short-subunit alcohol dehydrogenase family)
MRVQGKVVVVTGGANGIGRALALRFHREQAAAVVVADLDEKAGKDVAAQAGGLFVSTNVAREDDVRELVRKTIEAFGRVDLFCSNAGILGAGGPEASDDIWLRSWEVNCMAHVFAARAVLPGMLERGEGYLLQTVSAAGLLSNPGAAPYTVSKHAALALAEWLSITYEDRGITVSCVCPQTVRTNLITGSGDLVRDVMLAVADPLEPEDVARCGDRRAGRGSLPDPSTSRGGRVLPAQGGRLRAMAQGDAKAECPPARRSPGDVSPRGPLLFVPRMPDHARRLTSQR